LVNRCLSGPCWREAYSDNAEITARYF
jgi:hypothetical protein